MADDSLFRRVLKNEGVPDKIIDGLEQLSVDEFLSQLADNIDMYQSLIQGLKEVYNDVECLKNDHTLFYAKNPKGQLLYFNAGKKKIGYRTNKNDLW